MEVVARNGEEFSVLERFQLLNGVLPQQGDITAIRLLRRFRESLSFSEEELASLKFTRFNEEGEEDPGGTTTRWHDPGRIMKTVEVGPKMRELVVSGLKNVSNAGQLTDQHLALVDRFMPEDEGEVNKPELLGATSGVRDPYGQDARAEEDESLREEGRLEERARQEKGSVA